MSFHFYVVPRWLQVNISLLEMALSLTILDNMANRDNRLLLMFFVGIYIITSRRQVAVQGCILLISSESTFKELNRVSRVIPLAFFLTTAFHPIMVATRRQSGRLPDPPNLEVQKDETMDDDIYFSSSESEGEGSDWERKASRQFFIYSVYCPG
jgi:hypothetical protein